MRRPHFQLQDVLDAFRQKKVLTREELLQTAGCSSMTAWRLLKAYGYSTSYNFNGRFYMLTDTPAVSSRPVNASAVYCTPWSVLKISGRPCDNASSNASRQNRPSNVLDTPIGSLLLPEEPLSDGRTFLNPSVWFVDQDGYRVVFQRHEPIYRIAANDQVHQRLVAVMLRQSRVATQEEICRAFGHSLSTQARWERQYAKHGIDGGFDVITYRKGKIKKLPTARFAVQGQEIEGAWREYTICDRPRVRVGGLPAEKKRQRNTGRAAKKTKRYLWMREVRVLREDGRVGRFMRAARCPCRPLPRHPPSPSPGCSDPGTCHIMKGLCREV